MKRRTAFLMAIIMVFSTMLFLSSSLFAASSYDIKAVVREGENGYSYQAGDTVTVDIKVYDADFSAFAFLLSFPKENLSLCNSKGEIIESSACLTVPGDTGAFYVEEYNEDGYYDAATSSACKYDNTKGQIGLVLDASEKNTTLKRHEGDGPSYRYLEKSSDGAVAVSIRFRVLNDCTLNGADFAFNADPVYATSVALGDKKALLKMGADILRWQLPSLPVRRSPAPSGSILMRAVLIIPPTMR